ncbi:hypothetical protein EDD30_6647 [Couchioplanes caeruleus]|uniref:Resolvase/invertase-type recombinase catalytic domain-containing protein n=1 Tax=Couchioplanes caeruleus TaxID=56438 RepID=A0A3N1GTN2_9ACTN|nr:hypothetical protein EDD30_6647 [Couchioplanes caeruleus]
MAALVEQLKAPGVGLEFLAGELQGSHAPSGIVFTVLAAPSGREREYIRDRTLEGHESGRTRGKSIGGASVTDDHMLSMALHLRSQEMSLRDVASQLVITKGEKKGQHPSPAARPSQVGRGSAAAAGPAGASSAVVATPATVSNRDSRPCVGFGLSSAQSVLPCDSGGGSALVGRSVQHALPRRPVRR